MSALSQFLSGGGVRKVTTYTSGSGTHVPQPGTKWIKAIIVGGGGGGGHSTAGSASSGGGGGGACNLFEGLAASYAYSVGAGGTAGTAGGKGGNGGSSNFGTVYAYGGGGGSGTTTSTSAIGGGGGGIHGPGSSTGAGGTGGIYYWDSTDSRLEYTVSQFNASGTSSYATVSLGGGGSGKNNAGGVSDGHSSNVVANTPFICGGAGGMSTSITGTSDLVKIMSAGSVLNGYDSVPRDIAPPSSLGGAGGGSYLGKPGYYNGSIYVSPGIGGGGAPGRASLSIVAQAGGNGVIYVLEY
jgi:hypothetical protein